MTSQQLPTEVLLQTDPEYPDKLYIMADKVLFQIDAKYPVGSDKHYTFCYLSDPFVNGPARNDFNTKKLSAMKRVFQNQYGEEAIPLMCMILSDCGDSTSSDLLKRCAPSPFVGENVKEEKRKLYNFRCLLVCISSKLDSKLDSMIELLQEELQNRESAKTRFQTVLLLLERAHQASIILPQKLTQLEEWLGVFERDDLIREYVNQFDPKKQFPGIKVNKVHITDFNCQIKTLTTVFCYNIF